MAQALGTIGFGLFGLAYTRYLARQSPSFTGWAQRWGEAVSSIALLTGAGYLVRHLWAAVW